MNITNKIVFNDSSIPVSGFSVVGVLVGVVVVSSSLGNFGGGEGLVGDGVVG